MLSDLRVCGGGLSCVEPLCCLTVVVGVQDSKPTELLKLVQNSMVLGRTGTSMAMFETDFLDSLWSVLFVDR